MLNSHPRRTDRGAVLPLVLVVTVVLALVVVAVAGYTSSALRYGKVVESRADRIASADSAMSDAVEQLELRRPIGALCSTFAGDGAGVSVPFPQQVNGVDVTVNCKIVGGTLPPVDGWALVITGLGPGGAALPPGTRSFEFTNGGTPEIGGPVYVHDPTTSRMTFSKTTTIVEGDIWYPDSGCANAGGKNPSDINFERSTVPVDGNLKFDPTSRSVYCLNQSLLDLFGATGPTPDLAGLPMNPPSDTTTSPGCTMFSPGVYTTQPVLGNNNYFRSGTYEFRNIGKLEVKGSAVHFGHDPTLAGTYPVTDNSACDYARQNDAPTGATLYTSGNTQIDLQANSAFEISRRSQGYNRPGGAVSSSLVSFQVLSSSLTSSQSLIEASSGAKKEFAAHGLVWAPHSSVLFDTVPTQKAAALRGGAVIGRLVGGVTASASGFVIEVPSPTSNIKVLLTAVATDDQGETSVRVVADYRPTSGETAVNSWRVVD